MEIVKNKKIKIAILFTFIVLILFNCSNTNENEIENLAPSIFEITVNSVKDNAASISWNKSIDPEGNIVFYDVYLNSIKIIDNITELSFDFKNLNENEVYSGEIVASDPQGNTISVPFTFETSLNQPPSLFTITINSANPFYSNIEWTKSVDPEGEIVTYNIYENDVLLEEGTNSLNHYFSELKGLYDYNGRVEAIDVGGKKTVVEYSFTTTIKVYDDDLSLENQSSVEVFGKKGYNEINGNLNIGSVYYNNLTDVRDLSLLESIISVKKNISIKNTICKDFKGLENISLSYDSAKLTIENNNELLSCNGLNSITKTHEIYIANNEALLNLEGLMSLHSVTNHIWITSNSALNSLTGIKNLRNIKTFNINNNISLLNLIGLENIIKTTGEFVISSNDKLENLKGLNNLTSSASLIISKNDNLKSLSDLSNLNYAGSLSINENPILLNLKGLESLTNVNHTLSISKNEGLLTLQGIENIVFSHNSANYHSLTIWKNKKIVNLDPLKDYTFNRGKINIDFNSSLTDLCGLTTLISEINHFMNNHNFASNNGYNPSEIDILNGNCSL